MVLYCIYMYIQVEELYLDNVQSSSISGLTDAYTNLRKLSIVHCGLTTLEGLPALPSLEKVCTPSLHNLTLHPHNAHTLTACTLHCTPTPSHRTLVVAEQNTPFYCSHTLLTQIFLSDNRLTGGLEPLAKCTSLRKVELAGNKIEHLEDLKPLVSAMINLE